MGKHTISTLEDSDGDGRYRPLIEWSPLAMVVHYGGEIIYANPAALSLVGATTAQQVIGTKVLDWVLPEFHDVVVARTKIL